MLGVRREKSTFLLYADGHIRYIRAGYSAPAMRVAVVDIGTNSTRLLIADVAGSHVDELERQSIITRLGQGVDRTGALADEAIARVTAALDEYRTKITQLEAQRVVGVLTSATRDASNGAAFVARVRDEYGIDARVLTGDEEANMTFTGALSGRAPADGPVAVIDIGGGSTEVIVGTGIDEITFHVSMQLGVVRHTERFLESDPPSFEQLENLADDVRAILHEQLPEALRHSVGEAIAVGGTATSAAAIALELDPYDATKVEGYELLHAILEEETADLARLTDEQRRHIPGLHPDRAPTIVAGVIILRECIRALGLQAVEVSEHDILRGAALSALRRSV
jgi:exopolyphosphatase / guanosine-5'-triphosphate,3'-diphosphate pyrophosphatase